MKNVLQNKLGARIAVQGPATPQQRDGADHSKHQKSNGTERCALGARLAADQAPHAELCNKFELQRIRAGDQDREAGREEEKVGQQRECKGKAHEVFHGPAA